MGGAIPQRHDGSLPAVMLGHDAATALGVDQADGVVEVWLGVQRSTSSASSIRFRWRRNPISCPADRLSRGTRPPASSGPARRYLRTDDPRPGSCGGLRPGCHVRSGSTPKCRGDRSVRRTDRAGGASAAFQRLFLSLGAIALLVGGIGIANVMVISVLERRGEIGLRRAMGARRVHMGLQFLGGAPLLLAVGGAAGALLGALAVTCFAALRRSTSSMARRA